MLDYEYTRIGNSDYLLPNDVDYDQYRKFSSESSPTYTAPVDPAKK